MKKFKNKQSKIFYFSLICVVFLSFMIQIQNTNAYVIYIERFVKEQDSGVLNTTKVLPSLYDERYVRNAQLSFDVDKSYDNSQMLDSLYQFPENEPNSSFSVSESGILSEEKEKGVHSNCLMLEREDSSNHDLFYGFQEHIGCLDWGTSLNPDTTDWSPFALSVYSATGYYHQDMLHYYNAGGWQQSYNENIDDMENFTSYEVLINFATTQYGIIGIVDDSAAPNQVYVGIYIVGNTWKYLSSVGTWIQFKAGITTTSTWYSVRHTLNQTTNLQSIWINGTKVVDDVPAYDFTPTRFLISGQYMNWYFSGLAFEHLGYLRDSNRFITPNASLDFGSSYDEGSICFWMNLNQLTNSTYFKIDNITEFRIKDGVCYFIDSVLREITLIDSLLLHNWYQFNISWNCDEEFVEFIINNVSSNKVPLKFNNYPSYFEMGIQPISDNKLFIDSLTYFDSIISDFSFVASTYSSFTDIVDISDYNLDSRALYVNNKQFAFLTNNYNKVNTFYFQSVLDFSNEIILKIFDATSLNLLSKCYLNASYLTFYTDILESIEFCNFSESLLRLELTDEFIEFTVINIFNNSQYVEVNSTNIYLDDDVFISLTINSTGNIFALDCNGYIKNNGTIEMGNYDSTYNVSAILYLSLNNAGYNTFEYPYDFYVPSSASQGMNNTEIITESYLNVPSNKFISRMEIIGARIDSEIMFDQINYTIYDSDRFSNSKFLLSFGFVFTNDYTVKISFGLIYFNIFMNQSSNIYVKSNNGSISQSYSNPDFEYVYFSVFMDKSINSTSLGYALVYDEQIYMNDFNIGITPLFAPSFTIYNYNIETQIDSSISSMDITGFALEKDSSRITGLVEEVQGTAVVDDYCYDYRFFTPFQMLFQYQNINTFDFTFPLPVLSAEYIDDYYITYGYVYNINVSTLDYFNYSVNNYELWYYKQYIGQNTTYIDYDTNSTLELPDLFAYIQSNDKSVEVSSYYRTYILDDDFATYRVYYSFEYMYGFYISENNPDILTIGLEMIFPLLLLFIFVFVFYKVFGKNGVIIGLIAGVIVMYFALLIDIYEVIFLSLVITLIGIYMFKSKEKEGGIENS